MQKPYWSLVRSWSGSKCLQN